MQLIYIDRFGVEAVMGRRTLSAGEIKRMLFSEKIVNAVRSRNASKEWAEWAKLHPVENDLLNALEKQLNG